MLVRSHYPKKESLRKGFKNLLRGPLEKRVKPSRAELEKVEKEKKTKTKEKGKSRPQAFAAKPSTSSEVERLTTLVPETDLLPEASNPLLESIIENPVVQNQVFIATNESNITAVDPQGQSQTPTLYPWEHNTLVTSASHSEPYSLPISEQDIQCTAPSFTSSITQASDLELDLNDSFPLPESTQTQFGAPSIKSPLVPDYTQDFGDLSALAWPPDMGHNLQQELPPPAPSIFSSSSSSAGQNPGLVKATYDGGYSTRQAVTFDVSLDHSFIAQSSVEMLQHSFPIQVLSYPPGTGRKTKCPSGALIDIEQILYAWIEFESHHVPFPPTRPYFVVYNDFIGDDGIHITLGHDWVKKIEQACPQIG
ncbi:hypothetical protein H9Q69_007116 [Fusarium xylarioides]|uniref:Uncharacterized protein n=1 Tax=Fusarium xylarioides TaxID=221167 RepID=A0A9P7HKS0_9HYPO|nr:hypothetical protein H9Q72_010511 [Fusarium xylarioides]KAG5793832.1 hypothetical protein H9Q69_007116 [Fusarium xylarioides]KAG5812381.1 hypothetical protein H9Q71_004388 [Fusarium xylarioides]KAG5825823.1 hypothetical protein H9Q74_004099 [Fusarium xylarioides]